MKGFFTYRLKTQGYHLFLLLFVTLMLVLGAAALYTPPVGGGQNQIELLRMQAPALAELLNMRMYILPGDHLIALLFGLLLPGSSIVYVFSLARKLQAEPLYTGEVLWLISAPRHKGLVVLLHYMIMLLGILLQYALVAFAAWAARFIWPSFQVNLLPLLRVCLGAFFMMALVSGAALLAACLSLDGKLPRIAPWMTWLFLLVRMVANLKQQFTLLMYVTPFSLFDPWGMALGRQPAMLLCFIPMIAGTMLALLGALLFSRRDLS